MKTLIEKLEKNNILSKEEFITLLTNLNESNLEYLRSKARKITDKHYKNNVYIRGLIEFTNYCKEDCYYCGIRQGNNNITRFRLTEDEILKACRKGYKLGFRTFVLQGGEDLFFTTPKMVKIIQSIKKEFPKCAITLSIGVRSFAEYQSLKNAGADRFLLRHETANSEHFQKLHPQNQTFEKRKQALLDLKKIGFTVGSGMMVGSPYQTIEELVSDLIFLYELKPKMIGIGPFIPHSSSIFKNEKIGSVKNTLALISILRLMFPKALIPATTALNTAIPNGRIKGLLHGANVIMPNLSPDNAKTNYTLYDNKAIDGLEGADLIKQLDDNLIKFGLKVKISRGDPLE